MTSTRYPWLPDVSPLALEVSLPEGWRCEGADVRGPGVDLHRPDPKTIDYTTRIWDVVQAVEQVEGPDRALVMLWDLRCRARSRWGW